MRLILMGALVLGLLGTLAELLLLEHFEGWQQWVPILLLGAGTMLAAVHGFRPSRHTVRSIRALMWAFIASGIVGTWLHYMGNADFELELDPALAALALFKASMLGATPVLAPGAMIQLGLIGMAWSFRHPLVIARTPTSPSPDQGQ